VNVREQRLPHAGVMNNLGKNCVLHQLSKATKNFQARNFVVNEFVDSCVLCHNLNSLLYKPVEIPATQESISFKASLTLPHVNKKLNRPSVVLYWRTKMHQLFLLLV
jgi:hypothetical protein